MRYVPYSKTRRDETTDDPIGFLPQAFMLKPGGDHLSVNWLEFFEETSSGNELSSVNIFKATMQIGPRSAFGVASINKLKSVCEIQDVKVRVAYWPEDDNKSHSAILRIPQDNLALLESIAIDAFDRLLPAAKFLP